MYVNVLDLWSLQISLLLFSIGRIFPSGGGLTKESIIEGNLCRSIRIFYWGGIVRDESSNVFVATLIGGVGTDKLPGNQQAAPILSQRKFAFSISDRVKCQSCAKCDSCIQSSFHAEIFLFLCQDSEWKSKYFWKWMFLAAMSVYCQFYFNQFLVSDKFLNNVILWAWSVLASGIYSE